MFGIKVKDPLVLAMVLVLVIASIAYIYTTKSIPLPNTSVPREKTNEGFILAPDFQGIKGYINTDENLSLKDLKGKVVLVDFWTYSCVNCIRTLPHLKEWHEKYSDKGFVIVGVHSPEFEFEKEYENVLKAVEKYGLDYPVIQDNDFQTWRAYKNSYWPRKYLIDTKGQIRYDHIGEGAYEETEEMIIKLLMERDESLNISMDITDSTIEKKGRVGTPELYLGYKFARTPLGNPEGFQPEKIVKYTLPEEIIPNIVYLEGQWENTADYTRLVSEKGKVLLYYSAGEINIVAGSPNNSKVKVFIDNEEVKKEFVVNEQTLYNVDNSENYKPKLLVLEIEEVGFELYTFTFG